MDNDVRVDISLEREYYYFFHLKYIINYANFLRYVFVSQFLLSEKEKI